MKKIPMKKRERPEQRAVTFTKRRNGLFKKAEELCVLCDAQIAMLVSSPNKKHSKIYSFGHSLILDAVLNDDVPDAVDDETKKSALSLYNEAKALEHYMENNRREVEEDLDSIQSVEVVHLITDKMKRVKENVNIRLNILKSPKIVTSGSNSAYATTNHCDGDGQFKHNNNIIVIDDYDKHDGLSQFDTNIGGTSSGSTVAAAVCGFNHDNGNDHFKNDNNVIIINDNNKHDGQSHYDTSYENFSTLTPLGLFNDYNPSLSSIYGSSFVDMDYNRIVPESVYGFSSTGQIVEGNKEKYDVQQTVTSSASNYDYNFDQSFVGGEHNTKKADECMWVELKNKEANSWAITTENLPNFGYLNQEVRDGDAKLDDYWASANSTSNSIILNVANNDAPLFTDAIRTVDCAYQSANVNPPLSMSIAGTVEYKGLPQSNDWPLP